MSIRTLIPLFLSLSLGIVAPAFAQLDDVPPEDLESDISEPDIDLSEEPAPTESAEESEAPTQATPTTSTPTPSNSEKIFDWDKYPNARQVPHPFAKKGLLRVTKDNVYIYRVNESEQKTATTVRIGPYNPENLENPEAAGSVGSTFGENYDQTDIPKLLVDWEWHLWKSPIGKWGATLGAGVYVAQGNGHFVNQTNNDIPKEVFTFVLVPVNVGAVYRLQIWHRQLFVPYAAGGGTIFGFSEIRDDHKPPKWGGALGGYYAGGLGINLTYFDKFARAQLDREYGINTVYLTLEYRGIVSTPKYDLSGDFFNAGLLLEY